MSDYGSGDDHRCPDCDGFGGDHYPGCIFDGTDEHGNYSFGGGGGGISPFVVVVCICVGIVLLALLLGVEVPGAVIGFFAKIILFVGAICFVVKLGK